MISITIYTTHCPRCEVLKKKLEQKGITWYIEIDSMEIMNNLGIKSVPMMSINDGKLMNFEEAIKWINSVEGSIEY